MAERAVLLQAQVRRAIHEAGYDLPDGPALPPRDVVDKALRGFGTAVSALACALGCEATLQLCDSTVPVARTRPAIRREMAKMLLLYVTAATELGLDMEMLIADAGDIEDKRAACHRG